MFFESRRKKATQEAPEATGTCNGKAVCCEHKDVKYIVPTGLFPRTEGCGYFWIRAWSHVTYWGIFLNPRWVGGLVVDLEGCLQLLELGVQEQM